MMSGLLPQVSWRRFVCVLRKLGYVPQKGKAGSGRSFFNSSRNPNVVTFREPHPGQNVRLTALREYLHKLGVTPEEFIQLLEDC
jgi:predicted RNA binding protein YcfA (HicA-like mRNA interferase family)